MSHRQRSLALFALALTLMPPTAQARSPRPCGDPEPVVAEYQVLDNLEGAWLNFGLIPRRALLEHDVDGHSTLIALNAHEDHVAWFREPSPDPFAETRVGAFPRSIAAWENGDGTLREVLVVCGASYGLFRIDPSSREVVGVIEVPAQPNDIVVDSSGDRAWVSCNGSVAEIDLAGGVVDRVYDLATEPDFRVVGELFLARSQGRILVAPMLSGNNTTTYANLNALDEDIFQVARDRVLDLRDTTIVPENGRALPDEDLFWIDPAIPSPGAVSVAAKGQGTVLFGHGVNPDTGRHWQLGTEAFNAHPDRQTEPEINGRFAENRVAIRDLADLPSTPPLVVDLDTDDTGPFDTRTYSATRSVGQPSQLVFSTNGFAAVAGPTTDTVALLRPDGTHYRRWRVPDGSVPYSVALDRAETRLYVHCHGTNTVEVIDITTSPLPQNPTILTTFVMKDQVRPDRIKQGFRLFADADFSAENRFTCWTCHPDGHSDGLAWNLEVDAEDEKGPLVTQTLIGIRPTGRLHWRGERTLSDFRGAFTGLLGSPIEMPEGDFEKVEDYIFSLQEPCNPRQDFERRVNATILPPGITVGDAVAGQTTWFDEVTVGTNFTCNTCHTYPSKAAGHEIIPEVRAHRIPERAQFDVAGFQKMIGFKGFQPPVNVKFVDPDPPANGPIPTLRDETRALLGAGTSHAGLAFNVRDFVQNVAPMTDKQRDDVSAFLNQFDTGLAPCAHFASYLDANTSAAEIARIKTALVQADKKRRDCDLVLIGHSESVDTGLLEAVNWIWDRENDLFVSDGTPGHPDRTLDDFLDNAATERHVVLGAPSGMGERIAIDRDMDGFANPADPDDCDPTVPTQPLLFPKIETLKVHWVARGAARVSFTTDTPTVPQLTATEPTTLHSVTVTSDVFSRVHSLIVPNLQPSNQLQAGVPPVQFTYTANVTATSRAGLTASQSQALAPTLDRVRPQNLILDALSYTFWNRTQVGGLQAILSFRVANVGGGTNPVENALLVARVFVHDVDERIADPPFPDPRRFAGQTMYRAESIVLLQDVDGDGVKDVADLTQPGPYLISTATGANGWGQLTFRLPTGTLGPNDQVTVVVDAVFEEPTSAGGLALFYQRLDEATNCALNGGVNADCDGDGVDDCCRLELNRPWSQTTRWSFPATPTPFRSITRQN